MNFLGKFLFVSTLVVTQGAFGQTLSRISEDPYTNSQGVHQTEVEPSISSHGLDIVSAFQVGRITSGASTNIGWATSHDGGKTWHHGPFPKITKYEGGSYARVSDPSVAYDSAHGLWLVTGLAIAENNSGQPMAAYVTVSRSSDGENWEAPTVIYASNQTSFPDKEWISCDNGVHSPYLGRCYVSWRDFVIDGNGMTGGPVAVSYSSDGGLSWGPPQTSSDKAVGTGSQNLISPSGLVTVTFSNSADDDDLAGPLEAFQSLDGGQTWSKAVTVSEQKASDMAVSLRAPFLVPSAVASSNGKIFVAWVDCRFENNCATNDLVISSSTDGQKWETPRLVPIPRTLFASEGRVDFIEPALAVDASDPNKMALVFYVVLSDGSGDFSIGTGTIYSQDAGLNWSGATNLLVAPMKSQWLVGLPGDKGESIRFLGDYIGATFSGGKLFPALSIGQESRSPNPYDQGIFTLTY